MDKFAPPIVLRFDREPVPTPGPVTLLFGDDAPAPEPVPAPGVRLVFSQSPVKTPGSVRLVFGETGDAPVIPEATLHGAGQITGLRLRVALRAGAQVRATGRITGLRLHIATKYDINVSRPTVGRTHAHWQDADLLQNGVQHATQDTAATPAGAAPGWQLATPEPASTAAAFTGTARTPISSRAAFENATRALQDAQALHSNARRDVRNLLRDAFENAARAQTQPTAQRHQDAYRDRRTWRGAPWQVARPMPPKSITSAQGPALPLVVIFAGDYQNAMRPPPGIYVRPPVPGPVPCYLPALPAHLVFTDPHDTTLPVRLTFVCETGPVVTPEPGATVVVPTLRVYIVINDASLRRVDGNVPIPTFSMSMSLDTDSWAWGFNAEVPRSALNALQPSSFGDPVELEALVNGVPYRFLAEQLSTSRTFGRESLRIGGRGLTATLDAPYAPSLNFGNASARTAQQLMGDVLTINGVGLGWSVDWQLTDWLVPGNVWSLQGSYVDALNSIVQSAGGYLQPHAVDKTVKALRRYPTAPWDWGTTAIDVELPADVTTQEGISWKDNPRYNRVFVSGTAGGVLGQVTRAGTDGALIAPMVTDSLITHADAARQRGISVLATSGRQAMVNLQLPVLASTGIITPGKMVRYVDGATSRVGITRSVQVDVRMPEISQQIEVETYA